MDTLAQDLRYALRRLARSPGFTLVAVLTLALGIGANSAIFSVVHGVLLRSLPFAEPERLVSLYTAYPQDETRYPLSAPDFMSIHDDARSFAGVAAVYGTRQTRTGGAEPVRVEVGVVSGGFLEVMGITPVLGRGFRAEENAPGRNTVALLSNAYWRQHFGADPGVIGRTLTLNGVAREVVGVLPPEFDFPGDRQVYFPLAYNSTFSSTTAEDRRGEYLQVVARLRPGVAPEQAAAEVATVSRRLQQEFPETNSENITLAMTPLQQELLADVRTPLLVLLGAVGLVLLIACVNVANLLLARATAREGELAVRAAMGAGRHRLVRQLLTESVLLGVLGGAAGLLLAVWATQALVAVRPEGIPRLDEVSVSGTVVGFTAALAVLTGLLFGLIPAVQITRSDLSGALREGGRGLGMARGANRTRGALVVAQMALAVVLLVGAGLLIRSFMHLTAVEPGFRTEQVITFDLSLPRTAYGEDAEVRDFYARLQERLQALPGVRSVAAAAEVPLRGTGSILGFDIENRVPPPAGFVQDAVFTPVTPGYLQTLAIPLRRGRGFSEQDREGSPGVALVNEAFVRRYFADEEAVGRRVSFNGRDWVEIVGVTGDVPQVALSEPVRPAVYAPFRQFTTSSMTVALRTSSDPLALAAAVRREVRALDPSLPVEQIATGGQLVSESVAQPRFYALLLSLFAAVALTLAAVGLFGVMSFAVAQRKREIGIRMALGAPPGEVLRRIVSGALVLAAAGIAAGLAGAVVGSRLLSGMLYGVGTLDPLTFAIVAVALLAVAALASYLPARAATRVDPNVALRAE